MSAIPPQDPAALCTLGWNLLGSGKSSGAEVVFRQALALDGSHEEAKYGLAATCLRNRRWAEGRDLLRACLEQSPNQSDYWSLLAKFHRAVGAVDDAIGNLRQAVKLAPDDPWVAQRLLAQLLLQPETTPEALCQAHAEWAEKFAAPFYPSAPPPVPALPPDRRLRVGYVSPDWREHPVGRLSEALLRHHDRDRFEVFCYSRHHPVEDCARTFARLPEHWVDASDWTEAALADRIRQDGIHVLIDLAGHTRGGCPLLFARQPAPVQVTFLGYPATTGLRTIRHRLTDALADPPGSTDGHCTEQLTRLPTCAWCLPLSGDVPPVNPLPAANATHGVTFGNFANVFKTTDATLELWARVLHAVAGSRLVLKCSGYDDPGIRDQTLSRLTRLGLSADRFTLRGFSALRSEHLAAYHEVDLALDTFPYHGTATTFDALQMGVPVLSLTGTSHVSRVGVSLLHHAGLADTCLAHSAEDFVAKAVALAGDRPALGRMRNDLRAQLARSPLSDAAGYTRHVEVALQEIWTDFASQAPGGSANLRA